MRKESIIGLTTAAGLWATVGIGLCFGSGMFVLGIAATMLLELANVILRVHHQRISFQTIITVTSNLTKHEITIEQFNQRLIDAGAKLRDYSFTRSETNGITVKTNIVLSDKNSMTEHVEALQALPFIDSFDVYPS